VDLGISGKRAAVAAASIGLGFASAKALANEGVHVAICGRDRKRVDAAAKAIGHDAVPLVRDVSTADGGQEFVEAAIDALGGIDILIANAGGPPAGAFKSTEISAYREALELNLLSVVGMCQGAVPSMKQQRWGRIVAITSLSARQPVRNLILSNTTRPATTGFLKSLALEIAPYGITVNSVQPGPHGTARMKELASVEPATLGIRTGSFGDPDDFGAIVSTLCSEQARFAVGVHLHLDGGSYAGLQ
jgi:3-oxoacyl-[acyl-carrier protein] reductase